MMGEKRREKMAQESLPGALGTDELKMTQRTESSKGAV